LRILCGFVFNLLQFCQREIEYVATKRDGAILMWDYYTQSNKLLHLSKETSLIPNIKTLEHVTAIFVSRRIIIGSTALRGPSSEASAS
jgi:hypothetical protein